MMFVCLFVFFSKEEKGKKRKEKEKEGGYSRSRKFSFSGQSRSPSWCLLVFFIFFTLQFFSISIKLLNRLPFIEKKRKEKKRKERNERQ